MLLPLVSSLLLAPVPWRAQADLPDRLRRIGWGSGAVVAVVRPIAGTWRLLPREVDKKMPNLVTPERASQDFLVLDASRAGTPRRIALRFTRVRGLRPVPRDAKASLEFDAPSDPNERFLTLLEHPKDRPWSLDAPDDPRALVRHDRDVLVGGKGAKAAFFNALVSGLSRRKSTDSKDAYAWLGAYFRSEVAARPDGGVLGAYLADVSGDAVDADVAAKFALTATKADPVSQVYLTYLAAVWGGREGVGFAPFFDALVRAKTLPALDSAVLYGLTDTGVYRVLPVAQADPLAFRFEGTEFFLFLLSFAYGTVPLEDLRRVYQASQAMADYDRFALYQYLAGRVTQPDAPYRDDSLADHAPRGVFPVWRLGGIDHEADIRAKLDAFFRDHPPESQ